ncbi:MAG: hypothetical protein QN229_07390 [Desulfurococcaceae archaeon TW002]
MRKEVHIPFFLDLFILAEEIAYREENRVLLIYALDDEDNFIYPDSRDEIEDLVKALEKLSGVKPIITYDNKNKKWCFTNNEMILAKITQKRDVYVVTDASEEEQLFIVEMTEEEEEDWLNDWFEEEEDESYEEFEDILPAKKQKRSKPHNDFGSN